MLISTRMNIGGSLVREIASTSPSLRQGMALQLVMEEGVGKVAQSATTGVFAGIAFNEYKAQDRSTKVEEFSATAETHKLSRQALGGDVWLEVDGTGAEATMDTDGQTVTGLTAGKSYKATYAYAPTVVDIESSRTLLGMGTPSFVASDVVNSISVIVAGDIFTDYYDVAVDWSVTTPKAGASGLLSATGADISSAQVIGLPTPNNPFLGVYFRA